MTPGGVRGRTRTHGESRLTIGRTGYAALLALFLCIACWAGELPDAVVLDDRLTSVDLDGIALRLEDPEGTLAIGQIRSDAYSSQFQAGTTSTGLSASAFWWRFRVNNATSAPLTLRFDTGGKTLYEVDLYGDDGRSDLWHQSSGVKQRFEERPLPSSTFAFPVTLPPNGSATLYLRVRSYGMNSSTIHPALWARARMSPWPSERPDIG